MTRALVTGATGFVGQHLVRHLTNAGIEVTCLVRRTSDLSRLTPFNPNYVYGDVRQAESLKSAIENQDWVFHLAGLTKAIRKTDLQKVNQHGTETLAKVCSSQANPPTFIHVSSIAACGASRDENPLTEIVQPQLTSHYGRSKLCGEQSVAKYGSHLPVTILRPPIVLGEFDKDGFQLFSSIQRFGLHLIPTWQDHYFSVIHAEDLANALLLAAQSGKRLPNDQLNSQGIYFATTGPPLTYADLGRMITQTVGRSRTRMVHLPTPLLWCLGYLSELTCQIRRKPGILNLDKIREAVAGSWACSDEKIRQETSYQPEHSLMDRIQRTADWYFEQGWLKN